jgi:hypothetical protein
LDGYTTEGYTFKQSEDKKREEEKTPNNQNAHVGVDIMQIIHTLNCCGKALSPKSEIFKFPALSRSKFSGCQSRGKQETCNIRTEMTKSKVNLSFACAEGNADYLHNVKVKKKKNSIAQTLRMPTELCVAHTLRSLWYTPRLWQ